MLEKQYKKFYEHVLKNEHLQQKFKGLNGKSEDEIITNFITVANEEGFDFKKEELISYISQKSKEISQSEHLSEEELEQVAGGKVGEWIFMTALVFTCAVSGFQYAGEGKCGINDMTIF